VNTFSPEENSEAAGQSVISLMQTQLQGEATQGWELKCLPRPWKDVRDPETDEPKSFESVTKVPFPTITVPNPVPNGARPLFPEVYLSVYANQEVIRNLAVATRLKSRRLIVSTSASRISDEEMSVIAGTVSTSWLAYTER
jgi:hypothetical protein